jgi:hypothetical protein
LAGIRVGGGMMKLLEWDPDWPSKATFELTQKEQQLIKKVFDKILPTEPLPRFSLEAAN